MEINRYTFGLYGLMFLLLILSHIVDISTHAPPKEAKSIKHSVVKYWADKLGDLSILGDFVTHRKEIHEGFKAAQITPKSGKRIIEAMAEELKYMFDQKVSAVRKIMENAQTLAQSHEHTAVVADKPYYNSKDMLEYHEKEPNNITNHALDDRSIKGPYIKPSYISLTENKRFFNTKVNISMSSVHVPTNVFDRDNATLWAIQWSEKLDDIFLSNYREDPTLSWQFFGSASGFMRQFPASKWGPNSDKSDAEEEPVDLYDCRLRSWYIEAANSPKDVVILVDISGSMTGQRKDIARHVVYNILDTLGTNDFVTIFKFNDVVTAAVECFNTTLVQATLANIRELKMSLETILTKEIANYTLALAEAFDALEITRNNDSSGAHCNQAIMLISDGVPYDLSNSIEKNNYQNNTFKPVRIFTYLIGKEVADVKNIKDMACNNLGYYVHLSTLAEVREQVLHYIPVMARPLVLGGVEHPIIWTQAYADVIDPLMTDWTYELQERDEQKKWFQEHREDRVTFDSIEGRNRRLENIAKKNNEVEYDNGRFNLVTTVSMPVYDKRKNATYIANLLGVAGTDIPIKEIQKMLSPFKLGVNGYSFLVTNNGFVLMHPDLRPTFRGILKPDYNSIDLLGVELLDDNTGPREYSEELIAFRDEIINQTTGNRFLIVKQHLDKMKRVSQLARSYYWQPIGNTPFTLVISMPKPYGLNRVELKSDDDIHMLITKKKVDVVGLFNKGHFRIHPDWIYCRHNIEVHDTPEEELRYFLKRISNPKFQWKDRASHQCDRELVQQLVFDAWKTKSFSIDILFNKENASEKGQLMKIFGVKVAFLATQSGLTRWIDFNSNKAYDADPHFSEIHYRAIDEVWYKRAVEQHYVEQKSFVFSVPFDVGDAKNTLVTASHAIFVNDDMKSAPAAVVGYQFLHSELYTFFKNVTSKCGDSRDSCDNELKCFTDEAACYVLDNNGFVVISTNKEETGQFYGEVKGSIMARLIAEDIYLPVTIHDYQGVCFVNKADGSAASILQVPILHFMNLLKWFGRVITWAFIHLTMMTPTYGYSNYEEYDPYADFSTLEPNDNLPESMAEDKSKVNGYLTLERKRLQPCDKTVTLYTLGPAKNKDTSIYDEPANACEKPFVVVPINGSNLILLVFDITGCLHAEKKISIDPVEKEYGKTVACHRKNSRVLSRRKPAICINHHVNESLITQCGRGYSITMSVTLIAFILIIQVVL